MLWQFKCYQTEINVRIQGAAYSWMIQGEGSCCKRSVKPQDLVLGLFCSIPSWQPGYHCHAYNHAKGSSCTLSCSIWLALVPWLLLGHTSMTWDFVSQHQSSPALLPREIAWAYVHVCTMIMYSIIFPSLYCIGVIALWQQSSVQCQGQFGKQMIVFFFQQRCYYFSVWNHSVLKSQVTHFIYYVLFRWEFLYSTVFLRMENHNWISPCTHGRAGSVLQQGKCTLQDANSAIILVSCI